MASRTFTDRSGVLWTVWDVVPGTHSPQPAHLAALPEEMAGGWLCFESASEKRRMFPVPPEWERLADDKLEILLRAGIPVAPRRSSSSSAAPPDEPAPDLV